MFSYIATGRINIRVHRDITGACPTTRPNGLAGRASFKAGELFGGWDMVWGGARNVSMEVIILGIAIKGELNNSGILFPL